MNLSDRHQLLRYCEDVIAAVETLGKAWIAEDRAACTPGRRSDGPISGGGPSDVTQRLATGSDRGPDFDHDPTVPAVDAGKYQHRDRIAALLADGERLIRNAKTLGRVRPCRDCACCGLDSATHGRSEEGPALCFSCWRFLRDNGVRCTPEIHEARGRVELCQCPVPECCPGGCGRRADDGAFAADCRKFIDARRTA